MSSAVLQASRTLSVFAPPYQAFSNAQLDSFDSVFKWRGQSLIWRIEDDDRQRNEIDWVKGRPVGLPLVVILPAPDRIHGALFLLSNLNTLEPKAVFPAGQLATPQSIKRVLSAAPANLADATASYLTKRGILDNRTVYNEVRRIFELSEEVHSISTLARRMYTSRRTLGRHLALSGLPVPSHWLQFARLIRVCIRLQSEQTAVFRIAHRAKYPDGFTLSNQMSRILGIRPSLVRTLIGWEWIVESWLSREGIISDLQHTDSLSQC